MDQLCEQCGQLGREIESFLTSDVDHFRPFTLGSRRELFTKAPSCKLCRLSTQALYSYDQKRACEDPAEIECLVDDSHGNVLQLTGRYFESGIGPLYLLPLCRSKKLLSGRLVDRDYVNVDLIRSWIRCCDGWHRGTCDTVPSLAEPSIAPARVIDVNNKCLVSLPRLARYVALSYVWGQGKNLVTTTDNLKALQKPGALDGDTVHIPRTVQDAMTLTSLVGESHLWVDALCIVQNDEVEKPQQIKIMDSIYSLATFTIVAAAGDHADFGIPGVPGGTVRRQLEQKSVRICSSVSILASQPTFWDVLDVPMTKSDLRRANTWNSRAWTFQERILSRRSLIFVNESVHFSCQQMRWVEDVEAERSDVHWYFQMIDYGDDEVSSEAGTRKRRKVEYVLEVKPWPSMTNYREMVRDFSIRDLSFEHDIQAAFAGITGRLSRQFKHGFHYGLAEMFFHAHLLWQPKQKLRRRRRLSGDAGGPFFPSWSWMGWCGALSLEEWTSEEAYFKGVTMDDDPTWIKPTVLFYKKRCRKSSEVVQIRNDGQKFRHLKADPVTAPPSGWRRGLDPDCSPSVYYVHQSSPSHQFYWPVDILDPLSQPFSDRQNVEANDWPLLQFRTTSSHFALNHGKYAFDAGSAYGVSILDANQKWCGRIVYDESWQFDRETQHEFIVISEGVVPKKDAASQCYMEYEYVRREECPPFYHYVNVLLVERDDEGVAYRKALGRVTVEAWKASRPVEVEVVLG